MRIFVGNLHRETTDAELREVFEPYGEIAHVTIIVDLKTGRSRCYGFVEMPDTTEATTAIAGLQRTTLGGRRMINEEAHAGTETERPRRPREARRPRG